MSKTVLSIDLGGTKIAAAQVSSDGVISHRKHVKVPRGGGGDVVDSIRALIRSVDCQTAHAIGICVPGIAYPDGSVWAPNIPGWGRVPLASILAKEFGKQITVESDRSAFVVGEAWCGAACGCKDVVFLAIGTGVGAGIISDGHLLRGAGGSAGALGWTAVASKVPPGLEDAYRNKGCLESHLAGPSIARAASEAFGRPVDTRELITMARRYDARAREVLAEAGNYLGLILANLVSTLNPTHIVIGGGMAAAGGLLLEPARATMKQWAQPIAVQQVKILLSRLGRDASLLGVAKLAFERSNVTVLSHGGELNGHHRRSNVRDPQAAGRIHI